MFLLKQMNVWMITDDYDSFTNSKQSIENEKNNNRIVLKLLLSRVVFYYYLSWV